MASPPQVSNGHCCRFGYNKNEDKLSDTRNILLIVATLIIAVTFQAGVNPPGGVWQETTCNNINDTCLNKTAANTSCTNCRNETGVNPPGGVSQWNTNCFKCRYEMENCKSDCLNAGTAIYASRSVAFHLFLGANTLALASSSVVMIWCTWKFPFYVMLWSAIAGMLVTYGSAVFAISPEESVRFGAVVTTAVVPFVLKFLVCFYKWLGSKA